MQMRLLKYCNVIGCGGEHKHINEVWLYTTSNWLIGLKP